VARHQPQNQYQSRIEIFNVNIKDKVLTLDNTGQARINHIADKAKSLGPTKKKGATKEKYARKGSTKEKIGKMGSMRVKMKTILDPK
jgi:hypothetical protein